MKHAADGELQPVYGADTRWQENLNSPILIPPSRQDLGRYIVPMLGVYPARGCPFLCNFCSVTKIAGRKIRSQNISTTMASLRNAKAAGVRTIMFTSDNFNKYPQAPELLDAMIQEKLGLKFFVQCDTQIAKQKHIVDLLAKAGCYQMFVGVESFDRQTLQAAQKKQNRPDTYHEIVRMCGEHGISSHFSNIIGFPQDTEHSILEHLAVLREMAPTWASFYILCPIPGTEQYDDFLSQGLITERNAIATGLVDSILAPEQMGNALLEFINGTHVQPAKAPTTAAIQEEQLRKVLDLLKHETKVEFQHYRRNMIARRINRRMGILHCESLPDYIALLEKSPHEVDALSRDLVIGVTDFFRDSEAFTTLETQVVSDLVQRIKNRETKPATRTHFNGSESKSASVAD